jgi:hypothetical protein
MRIEVMPSSASTREPLVRAGHLKDWLAFVAREEDPWRARFFAALPEERRRMIESASRVTWLPAALHVELADILARTFGAARAHDYYRRAFARSLRGPFFDPLVRTAVRLLGLTPSTFLRWVHKGWEASFRDCGEVHGESREPGRGQLFYRNLPAVCIASDAWLDSAQGSAYGVYDLVEVQGVVRIDKSRRAEGSMQLDLEWIDRA